MKKAYFFAFMVLLFAGCKKLEDQSAPATGLPGTWELRYAVSGNTATQTNYPAGNGHIMVFTGQSYRIYDNGTLTKQGTYVLTKQHSYILNTVTDCIIFDGVSNPLTLIQLNGDQFSLAGDVVDAGSTGYTRIK